MNPAPPKIVLTGGPCGGKSTLMRELRAADPKSHRWILVPESAPLLFQAGLSARDQAFQAAVVRLQMTLEDACAHAAPLGATLVCHRGALDPLAYWLTFGWEEAAFYECVGFSRQEMLARYVGVLHLQTTAIGAEAFYRRWPDAHRPEMIAQAAGIDRDCLRAWSGHPRHCILENAEETWESKAKYAHQRLHALAGAARNPSPGS